MPVEVSSVNVYDSIVDTIRYREGEYPGNLIPVPAKIAKIDIEKIYYRFYLEDSPDMIWHETPSHFVFFARFCRQAYKVYPMDF